MPTQITSRLGIQEDSQTGKIVRYQDTVLAGLGFGAMVTEVYLAQQTAALTQTRLYLAANSGVYMALIYVDNLTGTPVIQPTLNWFSFGVGAGFQMTQTPISMAFATINATSTAIMLLRSAASDIFLSTAQTGAGTYNLGVELYRLS